MKLFIKIIILFLPKILFGQLLINELCSKGSVSDRFNNNCDWVELINYSDSNLTISNYYISDNSDNLLKWTLPRQILTPMEKILILCSGEDIKYQTKNWCSLSNQYSSWSYLIPTSDPDSNWKEISYIDTNWLEFKNGIYINDSNKISSIYLRQNITIHNKEEINNLIFHANYADAYVAYLNGIEIARSNNIFVKNPGYTERALSRNKLEDHSSGFEKHIIEKSNLDSILMNDKNILSIQIHNYNLDSTILGGQFFLHAGLTSDSVYYYPNPTNWFNEDLNFHHSNFKLSIGERIFLLDSNENVIDEKIITSDDYKISEGRSPDGNNNWCLLNKLSPNMPNDTNCFTEKNNSPEISHQSGWYNNSLNISLSGPLNSKLYYTLNGDIPDTNDFLYEGNIQIKSTSVLSVIAYSDIEDVLPSKIVDRTFFINEKNYNIVTISIITDSLNLWSNDSGIYVLGPHANNEVPYYGANFRQKWSRWSRLEIFDKIQNKISQEEFDLEIHGNYGRYLDQKSFRLDFKSKFSGDLNYPIISDQIHITNYNNINLRREPPPSLITDVYAAKIGKSKNIDVNGFVPCVLYLNGQFWGLYYIREKIDPEYIKSKHDIINEIDLINGSDNNFRVYSGDDKSFFETYYNIINSDPSSVDFYNLFTQSFDLDNYIDYFILQILSVNQDWITNHGNNIKLWRPKTTDGKWRYILTDLDGSMKSYNTNFLGELINSNSLHANIFNKFLENDVLKCEFSNKFHRELEVSSIADKISKLDSLVNQIHDASIDNISRWSYFENTNMWQFEIIKIKNFLMFRPHYALNELKANLNIPNVFLYKTYDNFLTFSENENYIHEWFFNNNNIPYNNTDTLYPLNSGNYFIKSTDDEGCFSFSNSINIDLSKPMINNIYPNPSTNIINVDFLNLGESEYEIHVLNITGEIKFLKKIPASQSPNKQVVKFNLNSLKNGTYLVKLQSKNNFDLKKLIFLK